MNSQIRRQGLNACRSEVPSVYGWTQISNTVGWLHTDMGDLFQNVFGYRNLRILESVGRWCSNAVIQLETAPASQPPQKASKMQPKANSGTGWWLLDATESYWYGVEVASSEHLWIWLEAAGENQKWLPVSGICLCLQMLRSIDAESMDKDSTVF